MGRKRSETGSESLFRVGAHPWAVSKKNAPQIESQPAPNEGVDGKAKKGTKQRLSQEPPTLIRCRGCGATSGPDTQERFYAFMLPHAKSCIGLMPVQLASLEGMARWFEWVQEKFE